MIGKHLFCAILAAAAAVSAAVVAGSPARAASAHDPRTPAPSPGVTQTNLVSDLPGKAAIADSNLRNAWGMSRGPNSPVGVSNNGSGIFTQYSGAVDGSAVVAAPANSPLLFFTGPATGQTFNSDSTGFDVPGTNAPATFIFASSSGFISAWNPSSGFAAVPVPSVPGLLPAYTGLTEAPSPSGTLLLAADFHGNHVDVFNSSFQKLDAAGLFNDPSVPPGYTPFNVQLLGNNVDVTYARQDAGAQANANSPSRGFVDKFSTAGTLEQRIAGHGALNSPWGLVIAPQNFGQFSGDLLVGNSGDGRINAFNARTGHFIGPVTNASGKPIVINGLKALLTGDAVAGGPDSIWFSSADANQDGLVGILTAN